MTANAWDQTFVFKQASYLIRSSLITLILSGIFSCKTKVYWVEIVCLLLYKEKSKKENLSKNKSSMHFIRDLLNKNNQL